MIVFSIWNINIYYYGLFYVISFILWYLYIKKIVNHKKFLNITNKKSFIEDVSFFVILWVLIWWRLWYVLFYNFDYFLQNPLKIFYIQEGWMAFVWAILWVLIALYYLSKKYKILLFSISDMILSFAPFGIFLWRIWNFLNKELYGKICPKFLNETILCSTYGDWNLYLSNQLFEAFFEWFLLFLIFQYFVFKKHYLLKRWFISIFFILYYSIVRFVLEFFRYHPVNYLYFWLSISQYFMILFFIFWIVLIYIKKHYLKRKN